MYTINHNGHTLKAEIDGAFRDFSSFYRGVFRLWIEYRGRMRELKRWDDEIEREFYEEYMGEKT